MHHFLTMIELIQKCKVIVEGTGCIISCITPTTVLISSLYESEELPRKYQELDTLASSGALAWTIWVTGSQRFDFFLITILKKELSILHSHLLLTTV